ncbi:unnamed protein product, partial [Heligmosomoides polygyrus]
MEPLCFSGLNHRPAVSWCSYTYRTRTGFRLITRVNYRIGDGSACADQLIRIGSHKLATLFPSIQCCLALMFAAERYADAKLRADTEAIIGSTFHLQMNLLRSYITMLERVVSDSGPCSVHHRHGSLASVCDEVVDELLEVSPDGGVGGV